MHILMVAESLSTCASLSAKLEEDRHVVNYADRFEDMLHFCSEYECNVVLLHDLPRVSSAGKMVRDLRKAGIKTPFIVLMSDRSPGKVSEILSAGADDCVDAKTSLIEILARINAVVRRSNGHAEQIIRVGPASVNLSSKVVSVNDIVVPLTLKEYQIVEALSLRKNSALSKEQLMNRVYCGIDEPNGKIIDVFVCKIRKKIRERYDAADLIHTVWGRGYMMSDTEFRIN